jgi:2-polyprenyl-3-methyl-5-hydroxy-6-metoxy-1,4-benzoquinol methylase
VDPKTPRKNTNHIYVFEDYQKREKQFIARYAQTLRLIKRYSPGKKVLEIGAGFGLLSSLLAKKGYEVDVLEPQVTPYYLKGTTANHIKKTFESFIKGPKKKYDAIVLYDVIEHVSYPKEIVRQFQKLLNKNGIVFMQTPNYLSSMAQMVRNWSWWMVEDHRFFFSKKSLLLLFSKKTWKERIFWTYEDWEDFKKNLDGNFGPNKFSKYIFFAWWTPLYFILRKFNWHRGKGGLIITIFQKK